MNHPIKRPSYEEHVSKLFTDKDKVCMHGAIDLRTYDGIKASASKVSEWIGAGRMPPPSEGRPWSREKLQTFRNWATNTGYAEKSFIRISPSESSRIRRSIHALGSEEVEVLKRAFKGIMDRDSDSDDPTSFFSLAGIHWLPGPQENTYCRHHDDAYNPWHRAYLIAFENSLRSVEGCEEVTLPYWDILGEPLPEWLYKEPFYPYKFPHRLESLDGSDIYEAGDLIVRNSASDIAQNVKNDAANIEVKIGEALSANNWRGFNGWSDWPNQHEGIIRAHDNGHGVCGPTIANQDVAAFDPLFWFFHCNWDRLWWKWQTEKNVRSLLAFKAIVSGDTHWLEEASDTLLAPFDANSAEMIELSNWNIDYEHPSEIELEFDTLIARAMGNIHAIDTFMIPATTRYSVRIKGINRLDIPGSFTITLYSNQKPVGQSRIFQPSTPRQCGNCSKHGIFNVDFIVDSEDISDGEILRVAIHVANKNGETREIPLSQAGNPTLNIRLLLDTPANQQ